MKIQKRTNWSYFHKSINKLVDFKMQARAPIHFRDCLENRVLNQRAWTHMATLSIEGWIMEIPVFLSTMSSNNWSKRENSWILRTARCSSWTCMCKRSSRKTLNSKCGCSLRKETTKCSSSSWITREQSLQEAKDKRQQMAPTAKTRIKIIILSHCFKMIALPYSNSSIKSRSHHM